jgi:thioesterase domain-containing protein
MIENDRYMAFSSEGKNPPLFWVTPYFVQYFVIRELGRGRRVYGLRGPRADPMRVPLTIDQIAAWHVETMQSLQPHGPYVLVGYCVAAPMALEIASRLVAQRETVRALVMINPPDPAGSQGHFEKDPLFFRIRFTLNRLLFHLQKTKDYTTKDKISYYLDSVARIRKRSTYNSIEKIHTHIDTDRAYYSSVYAFKSGVLRRYSGPVLLLRPTIKPRNAFDYANRRWTQLLMGELEIGEISGDSDSMWRDPGLTEMSYKIEHLFSGG